MKSDWPLVSIGSVAEIFDGPHATPKKTTSGPVFLGISALNRGRLDLSNTEHLSPTDFQKWTRRVVPEEGDVVFSYETRLGEVAIIPDGLQCCLGRRMALVRVDESRLEPNYFLYYFLSDEFQEVIRERTIFGSTVERLLLKEFSKFPIRLPPIEHQREVGSILKGLDDRIDLLRQTNTTLEAIAQTLFKSWFVDFDPVHAKAEGREPEAMDAATAALFPSEFEESELGLIPKGWSASAVYDLAEFINGAAYKAFDPNREKRGLPIIKIAELKAGVTNQTAYSEAQMPEKYLIGTGDILFSWSGNPDTSIDTFVWSFGRAWLNQHIFRVVPSSSGERSFVLLALKYLRPLFAGIARDKQTTGLGHVTVADLKRLRIAKPDATVLAQWSLLVDPIVERAFAVQRQAQSLVELRDALLPRLISGKLRLSDAEREIESIA